jgi:hypothetical protein
MGRTMSVTDRYFKAWMLSTVHPCSFRQMCLRKNAKSCKPVDTILKWRTSVDLHVGIFFWALSFAWYFFSRLYVQCCMIFFFFSLDCRKFFFEIFQLRPPQKSNGPPLRKHFRLIWQNIKYRLKLKSSLDFTFCHIGQSQECKNYTAVLFCIVLSG